MLRASSRPLIPSIAIDVSLDVSFLNVKLNDVAIDPLFELIVAVNVVQFVDFAANLSEIRGRFTSRHLLRRRTTSIWTLLRVMSITLAIQYLLLKGVRMRLKNSQMIRSGLVKNY